MANVEIGCGEELHAVVAIVRSHRVVLQYIPEYDLHGRRWDEAITRLRRVMPYLKDEEWEQLDEPAYSLDWAEGVPEEDRTVCLYTEYYVLDYAPSHNWEITAHWKSPSLSAQAEKFLQRGINV